MTTQSTRLRAYLPLAAAVAVALLSTGCKGKLSGKDAGSEEDAGGGTGLAAKDNDEDVVTAAKAALDCPTGSGSDLFKYDCPAYKAWNEGKMLGSHAATLVNFLEDSQPRVRYLGANGLSNADSYREDKALATRVVTAAENEKDTNVASPLGERVARIKVAKTGLFKRISTMAKTHKITSIRRAIASSLLFANSDSREVFDSTLALTKDPDADVRGAAVSAFWVGGSLSRTEACKMWEAHLEDPKVSIGGSAASSLGGYRGCGPQFDSLIATVQKNVTAASREDSGFVRGLGSMCENAEVTAPQKGKALAIAKTLVSDKASHVFVRTGGLNTVAKCDPTGGKAFIGGFTKDKEKWVAEEATKLLAAKKK